MGQLSENELDWYINCKIIFKIQNNRTMDFAMISKKTEEKVMKTIMVIGAVQMGGGVLQRTG